MAKWSEQHNGKFPDPYAKLKFKDEEKRKKDKKKKKKKKLQLNNSDSGIQPICGPGSAAAEAAAAAAANGGGSATAKVGNTKKIHIGSCLLCENSSVQKQYSLSLSGINRETAVIRGQGNGRRKGGRKRQLNGWREECFAHPPPLLLIP